MKAIYFTLSIFMILFGSCNKSKPEAENTVVYTVVETSNESPEFTIIYSTPQGDKTDGPIKSNSWLSKPL